ncbi:MAG: hypothetical protein JWO25_3976 [Alphaproteobacteria bacterium]|nr:hypothetical protein [Alphaproteobacteria bacterium]
MTPIEPATSAAPRPAEPRLTSGERVRIFAVVGFIAFLTAFHAPLDLPIKDLFHEGEYLAPRLLIVGAMKPLLIHGQINYLPAQLAASMCGPDHIVICTRATNSILAVAATLLLFACAFATARSREALLFVGLAVSGFLLTIDGRLFSTVGMHQGSPSVRDVALLAILWCLMSVPGRRRAVADLLGGAAGLIAGLSCFWAYNRGLIGVAIIPLYCVASLIAGRGARHALFPLLGLGVGLVGAVALEPDMARQHVANIVYWARHGDIWRYDASLDRITTNIPFYLILLSLIAVALRRAWRLWRAKEGREELPILLVLIATVAMVAQQSSNRDDTTHLMWVVPWALLLILKLVESVYTWPESGDGWARIASRHSLLGGSLAGLLLLDFFGTVSYTKPMLASSFRNLGLFVVGLPSDSDLMPPSLAQIVHALRGSGQSCTYVFNNGGAIYHLAGQRPCSSIIYPVYASPDSQARVIADLAKARPLLVVGLSEENFSHIDDRTLAMRTPLIAAWMERHYPIVARFDGTELRGIVPPVARVAAAR